MTQVHETNTYTQLLAHAKRYRPRRGAELEILVHVRRLLVLGVETAHRTGGRDGIRNERELTNIGALLARYVAESAAATGVDLSRAHVGVDSLFCRELVWWWVASMSGVPAGTKRTYGPRLAAVSRWLGHEHWGGGGGTPTTRRRHSNRQCCHAPPRTCRHNNSTLFSGGQPPFRRRHGNETLWQPLRCHLGWGCPCPPFARLRVAT